MTLPPLRDPSGPIRNKRAGLCALVNVLLAVQGHTPPDARRDQEGDFWLRSLGRCAWGTRRLRPQGTLGGPRPVGSTQPCLLDVRERCGQAAWQGQAHSRCSVGVCWREGRGTPSPGLSFVIYRMTDGKAEADDVAEMQTTRRSSVCFVTAWKVFPPGLNF